MPTYEYECLDCGHHFEIFQKMTDERIKACPKCQQPVRRLIGTGSGIIFKGTGFYATDYRKTSPVAKERSEQKTCQQCQQDRKSCEKEAPGVSKTKSP